MLHHVSLPVSDLDVARAMYEPALAALGYRCVTESEGFLGFGTDDGVDRLGLALRDEAVPAGPGFHLALVAPSPRAVDAFHAAAVANGGRSGGQPGPRPQFGPTTYVAHIRDPDGNRLMALFE